jgi:phosphoribosyl-ATP pyrophosphohydrolase
MNIIQKMADKFEANRIALKVLEEMAELNEVLIKRETKAEGMKPPMDKVIEEAGDLLFRLDIMFEKEGIKDAVMQRYEQKWKQIDKWFTNKYETQTDTSGWNG